MAHFDRFCQIYALWAVNLAVLTENVIKSGYFCLWTSSFWRVFDPFRHGSHMHDLRVHFQYWPNPHIYRPQGKSIIQNLFWSIPYTPGSEIGAIDHDFVSEISVLGTMCHPGVSKMSIFSDFWDFSRKSGQKSSQFLAERCQNSQKWHKMAKFSYFSHFGQSWLRSACNWLVLAGFDQKSLKMTKNRLKTAHFG